MPAPITTLTAPEPLTALDRCDNCPAAARVRTTFANNHDLLFCGHCYRKHRAALEGAASSIDAEHEDW